MGNYLRVRGEYGLDYNPKSQIKELPPRARRIPFPLINNPKPRGTTSACAENTEQQLDAIAPWRNYLRVRGEYMRFYRREDDSWELPPRARRIPCQGQASKGRQGTTSACAENTRR